MILSWDAATFQPKIAVYGLGYVGLPLAVAFGKTEWSPVVGLTRSQKRVDALIRGVDPDGETLSDDLKTSTVEFSADPTVLSRCNFIIVAVPTPVDAANQPDLTPVREASENVGRFIKAGSIVVYESTVYPGVTEDICIPIIEKASGLKCGVDWKIGYSPERINPGDKEHRLENVVKVVSGMDVETSEIVARVYEKVCRAGVHRAANIKTAEAEKVIENIQRDLNIALFNELSLIFERLGINTYDVIEAAATKWNFHKYQPGLVGGHCIGVDPYYLTYRAQELGYHPEVILAGRRINDSMPHHVAQMAIKGLIQAGKVVQKSRVLVMGLTFKEGTKDVRNSKALGVIQDMKEYGVEVIGHDPYLTSEEIRESFAISSVSSTTDLEGAVDAVVLLLIHPQFRGRSLSDLQSLIVPPGVLVDIKGHYRKEPKSPSFIYRTL